jgi:hypothetical protein
MKVSFPNGSQQAEYIFLPEPIAGYRLTRYTGLPGEKACFVKRVFTRLGSCFSF